jgi:hypothetical protein
MSVTIFPSSVDVNRFQGDLANSTEDLFRFSCGGEFEKKSGDRLWSSFVDIEVTPTAPSGNGFVYAAYRAYSHHHHLRLRPEDIWFSILSQLSFYVNKHAEELRSIFVSHEGKQKVQVTAVGTADTVNFGSLALQMTSEMDKFVHDKEWRGWFLPNFTTTTNTDVATAAVIMMGTMQAYFEFTMSLICGLPSVTLLGEREDWEELRSRLDKIEQLGAEPTLFANRLKTVLEWFIRSYETPDDEEVKKFWTHIMKEESNGSGPDYLSGWLTAFCNWTEDGELISPNGRSSLQWNGTEFLIMKERDIPSGYASVPVLINDNGHEFDVEMLAGSVGITISNSMDGIATDSEGVMDTMQPASGWFMYEIEEKAMEEQDNEDSLEMAFL